MKFLALSAHVSPQTTHFRVLDKSPVLGSGRGPPSCSAFSSMMLNNLKKKCKSYSKSSLTLSPKFHYLFQRHISPTNTSKSLLCIVKQWELYISVAFFIGYTTYVAFLDRKTRKAFGVEKLKICHEGPIFY